jgi:hypothetical protein
MVLLKSQSLRRAGKKCQMQNLMTGGKQGKVDKTF